MACRRRAQPDLSRQEIEGPVYVSGTEAIASFGHEQVRRIAPSQKASTPLEIADEHLPRGAVDRYQAGLAVFRSMNRQDVLVQVDVVQFQAQSFAEAKTCDAKKTKQTMVRPATQTPCGRKREGGCKELLDLSLGVDVRPSPLRTIGQQAVWRYLAAAVDCIEIARKATHEAQSSGPIHRQGGFWFLGPLQGKTCGDVRGALSLHERDKVHQTCSGITQLEPQAAPHRQIVLERRSQRGHRTPPGHGRAMVRNDGRSTFA